MLVAQVCVGWRKAALSAETLWSSITVTRDRPSNKLANLWISRALSAPLTIRLDCIGSSKVHIQPANSALAQYCDRWKTLELCLPESTVPRLHSIRSRIPSLESLSIRNPQESRLWSHEFNVFEFAPRLRNLSLGRGIFHAKLKMPWPQLTELAVHTKNITESLEVLRLVPNLVKCIVRNALSTLETSTLPQTMPILTFPHLCSFHVFAPMKYSGTSSS